MRAAECWALGTSVDGHRDCNMYLFLLGWYIVSDCINYAASDFFDAMGSVLFMCNGFALQTAKIENELGAGITTTEMSPAAHYIHYIPTDLG